MYFSWSIGEVIITEKYWLVSLMHEIFQLYSSAKLLHSSSSFLTMFRDILGSTATLRHLDP